MTTEILANERITSATVRLIEEEQMVGVISLKDALSRAYGRGLDLVVVSPGDAASNTPPVCRILDMDRWRFERAKHEREAAKRQRELAVETKEIQLRPVTDSNDIATKARKARGFLDEGNKVRVIVRFKGRERSHKAEGYRIMENFLSVVGEFKIDKPMNDADNDITIVLGSLISKAERRRSKEEVGK